MVENGMQRKTGFSTPAKGPYSLKEFLNSFVPAYNEALKTRKTVKERKWKMSKNLKKIIKEEPSTRSCGVFRDEKGKVNDDE